MNLVSAAPHARSMSCLVSAAEANLRSSSVRSENAFSISPFVKALNLALLMVPFASA